MTPPAPATPDAPVAPRTPMSGLVRSLIRPYRVWVVIIFAAMMVETLASLAAADPA